MGYRCVGYRSVVYRSVVYVTSAVDLVCVDPQQRKQRSSTAKWAGVLTLTVA